MYEQIFVSGVWHSGTRLITEIAKLNGYNLGKKISSRNDDIYAWHGSDVLQSDEAIQIDTLEGARAILERKWPFDSIDTDDVENFRYQITKARVNDKSKHNCCKAPGFSLMAPLIRSAFPASPIIHVLRNPIDVSLSEADNYFLRQLINDRMVNESLSEYDMNKEIIIPLLFKILGNLEWLLDPDSELLKVRERKSFIFWNALSTLRWILMQCRLLRDLEKHNIENHHIIRFENIVFEDKQEIEKLHSILKTPGKLKLPPLNKLKAFKYRTELPAKTGDYSKMAKFVFNVELIYEMCVPYLSLFGYTEIIEDFEKTFFKWNMPE
jgi:hypothetical protein